MSLTRLISSNPLITKSFPKLKPFLQDIDGRKLEVTDWKKEIRVPPIGGLYEGGLIGTAFDYVARAVLAKKLEKENVSLEKHLVAESGLLRFAELSKAKEPQFLTKDPAVNEERIIGQKIIFKKSNEILHYLQQEFNSSVRIRERFINEEESLSAVIAASIFLARLDEVFRSRTVNIADQYFCKNNERTYFSQHVTLDDTKIADNIYAMVLLFEEILERENWCSAILNPTFGLYSQLVGGADADFIVDDVLIDIKTKNKFGYDGADFAQLLGYAAMARGIGIEVNKIAMYFSRFGSFAAIDLDNPIVGGAEFLSRYLDVITSCKT